MMITYKLKINQQEPRILNTDMEFVTGDVGAYRLEMEFYDNGKRMDITDSLLTVRVKRADGVCFSEKGGISDNTGIYVPKNNLYSVPGELTLEIALSDSAGNYVTTKILTASVIRGIGDAPNGAQDDVSVYVTLLAQTKKLIDEANKLFETESSALEASISELEESLNTKADKETVGGGFAGGSIKSVEDSASAVGKGAEAKNGGFAGGLDTFSNAGGAIGQGAKASDHGGAVGLNAKAGAGFSGGKNAKAANLSGFATKFIDCIQLGDGTNSVEKSLQVYSYQLMDAGGKIPAARIPNSFLNFKGEVSKFSNLPNNAAEGDVYRIANGGVYSCGNVSNLLTGNFSTYFNDYNGDGTVYNFASGISHDSTLMQYFQLGMIGEDYAYYAEIYDSSGNYVCDIYENASTGPNKSALAPIMTGENTVAFYIAPLPATFYTISDMDLVYRYAGEWYPVSDVGWIKRELGDIDTALDSILSIQNTLTGGESE